MLAWSEQQDEIGKGGTSESCKQFCDLWKRFYFDFKCQWETSSSINDRNSNRQQQLNDSCLKSTSRQLQPASWCSEISFASEGKRKQKILSEKFLKIVSQHEMLQEPHVSQNGGKNCCSQCLLCFLFLCVLLNLHNWWLICVLRPLSARLLLCHTRWRTTPSITKIKVISLSRDKFFCVITIAV